MYDLNNKILEVIADVFIRVLQLQIFPFHVAVSLSQSFMALYKGTIAYLLKTEDGEISWTVCPKTLLCPNSYGNTIQKGLFNKLKEVPPTGSKRHNRMKNISCRRNIFRLLEREANQN